MLYLFFQLIDFNQKQCVRIDSLTTINTTLSTAWSVVNLDKTSPTAPITLGRTACALLFGRVLIVDITFTITGTVPNNVMQSTFYFPNKTFFGPSDLIAQTLSANNSSPKTVAMYADSSTSRIGVNGGSTTLFTSGTIWNMQGIVWVN